MTLFNHYIASSLHVGINVTALVFISSIYLNTIVSIWMYVVAFTATVFGYNTIKYGELASDGFPIRLDRYAWLSYLAAAVGLFALSRISREQQLIFVAVGFLVLFYAFPIQSNKRNIRNQIVSFQSGLYCPLNYPLITHPPQNLSTNGWIKLNLCCIFKWQASCFRDQQN